MRRGAHIHTMPALHHLLCWLVPIMYVMQCLLVHQHRTYVSGTTAGDRLIHNSHSSAEMFREWWWLGNL